MPGFILACCAIGGRVQSNSCSEIPNCVICICIRKSSGEIIPPCLGLLQTGLHLSASVPHLFLTYSAKSGLRPWNIYAFCLSMQPQIYTLQETNPLRFRDTVRQLFQNVFPELAKIDRSLYSVPVSYLPLCMLIPDWLLFSSSRLAIRTLLSVNSTNITSYSSFSTLHNL